MPGKLSSEQNEHLRQLVRKLLERYTQDELGKRIGLSQGSVSAFLIGRTGVSMNVAKKIAELTSRTLDDVLALREPGALDRYENRGKAAEMARLAGADEYHPDAVEFVCAMDRHGDDLPVKTWLKMIEFWDEQLRLGHLLPAGIPYRKRP